MEADLTWRRSLSETALKAPRKVIFVRAQYFKDVTENGVKMAQQMSYVVEQGTDAMFSVAHGAVRDTITKKIEIETAKSIEKSHLVMGGKKMKKWKGGRAADDSDEQSE